MKRFFQGVTVFIIAATFILILFGSEAFAATCDLRIVIKNFSSDNTYDIQLTSDNHDDRGRVISEHKGLKPGERVEIVDADTAIAWFLTSKLYKWKVKSTLSASNYRGPSAEIEMGCFHHFYVLATHHSVDSTLGLSIDSSSATDKGYTVEFILDD